MGTQNTQAPKTETRSASQRIADLENYLGSLYQTVDNMARDLMSMKEALKLLVNKTDAIVKASARGEIVNDELVNRIMIENNVEELANRVKNMIAGGLLKAQEQVGADSFVVGQELYDDGTVQNPRLQFALGALAPALQEKLKGTRAGDVVTLEEGKYRFKVLETYQIQQPTPPAEEAADPAPAEAPAEPQAEAAPAPAAPAPAQPDQTVTPVT